MDILTATLKNKVAADLCNPFKAFMLNSSSEAGETGLVVTQVGSHIVYYNHTRGQSSYFPCFSQLDRRLFTISSSQS